VLALMAEGRSNAGIAHRLWVTEGTVEKHVRSILTKLNLPETGDDHRRVVSGDRLPRGALDPQTRSWMAPPRQGGTWTGNPTAGLLSIMSREVLRGVG